MLKEYMKFPRDCETLSIIKEIEEILGLPSKNIINMNDFELDEYLYEITLLSM